MTNITKDELNKLIEQVKIANNKPDIFIIEKKDIKNFREQLLHLGNVKILVRD